MLQRLFRHVPPVFQASIQPAHLDVRGHAKNACAHFFLKAIHDRHDGNESRHAQGNAQQGNQRDERNKVIPALGARVAKTDE